MSTENSGNWSSVWWESTGVMNSGVIREGFQVEVMFELRLVGSMAKPGGEREEYFSCREQHV